MRPGKWVGLALANVLTDAVAIGLYLWIGWWALAVAACLPLVGLAWAGLRAETGQERPA